MTEKKPGMGRKILLYGLAALIGLTILGTIVGPSKEEQAAAAEKRTNDSFEAAKSPEQPEPPAPKYIMEKEGLAFTRFEWKQVDTIDVIEYSIGLKNVTETEIYIKGVDMGFQLKYDDGDSSGTYSFHIPIGGVYLDKDEELAHTGRASVPRSRRHKVIKDVELSIYKVDLEKIISLCLLSHPYRGRIAETDNTTI